MTAVPIPNPTLPAAIADAPVPTTHINKKRQLDASPVDEPAAGPPPAKRKKLEATPAKATPTIKRQQSLLGWAKPTKDATSDVPEPESSTSVVLKRDATLEIVFRGLDDETKALLKLESDTMEIGWLKVLGPELRKGYFIEVGVD
ncbi:hypothetical protein BC936DRAFT_136995 [Jimgerdemannia flammicorona]|uniref:Uncharacterized protein n=1 Tax=Jimgerdemannia flammicorona TaxID=994334 RepID=A0A433DJA0_9FUNG|nr:hypothetical protein BC936DRAFT_136995 [Jimgerdemannia flammicorona]